MSLETYLSEVRERLNAYALMDYSSVNEKHLDIVEALTDHAPTDLTKLLELVTVMREALEFYGSALNTKADAPFGEPNRDSNLMPARLGTRANEALQRADEIAGKPKPSGEI